MGPGSLLSVSESVAKRYRTSADAGGRGTGPGLAARTGRSRTGVGGGAGTRRLRGRSLSAPERDVPGTGEVDAGPGLAGGTVSSSELRKNKNKNVKFHWRN